MIVCPHCGAENQSHFRYCLGCGSRLPDHVAGGSPPGPSVPPRPLAEPPARPALDIARTSVAAAPSPAAGPTALPMVDADEGAPPADITPVCPTCSMVNPPGFAFCGRCGSRLSSAPIEPPPAPPRAPPALDLGSARTMFFEPNDPPAPTELSRPTPVKLVMLGPDGLPIGERLLEDEPLEIGRDYGLPWSDDGYLDLRHATLTPVPDGIRIDDHDSLNGVFMRITARLELQHGDQFRVGQELLLYEELPEPTPHRDGTERMGSPNPGFWGRVAVLVEPGEASQAHPITGEGITIGREDGDIVFPHDGYVSGTHCRISGDDNGIYLDDLESSNGTYARVRSGATVPFSSLILIGQRLFRVEKV